MKKASIPQVRFDSDSGVDKVCVEYYQGTAKLALADVNLSPEDIRHVWFRRPEELECCLSVEEPERRHVAEEWSAAIEGFLAHIPLDRWVNHPSRNAIASHKIEQLTRANAVGLDIPDTLLTQKPESLRQFWRKCDGEVIAKPMISAYLEREEPQADSQIYTNRVLREHIDQADRTLPCCPTLFQRMVRKRVDVRIASIDHCLFPIGIKACDGNSPRLDIRRNNMDDVQYVQASIPDDVRVKLLRLLDSYGLRFAAIDMAVDEKGNWIFFEINPNGQWAWTDLAGATDIAAGFIESFGR